MAIWLLELSPLNFTDNTKWVAMLTMIAFVVHWAVIAGDNLFAALLSVGSAIVMSGILILLFGTGFISTLAASLVAAAWLTMTFFAWIQSRRLWANSTTDFYLALFAATGMVAGQLSYDYPGNFDVANWFNAVLQWLLLASLVSLAIRGIISLIRKNHRTGSDKNATVYNITTMP